MPTLNILNPTELIKAPVSSGQNALQMQQTAANTEALQMENRQTAQKIQENRKLSELTSGPDVLDKNGQPDYYKMSGKIAAAPGVSLQSRMNTMQALEPLRKQQALNQAFQSSFDSRTGTYNPMSYLNAMSKLGYGDDAVKTSKEMQSILDDHTDRISGMYNDAAMAIQSTPDIQGKIDIYNTYRAKMMVPDSNDISSNMPALDPSMLTNGAKTNEYLNTWSTGKMDAKTRIADERAKTPLVQMAATKEERDFQHAEQLTQDALKEKEYALHLKEANAKAAGAGATAEDRTKNVEMVGEKLAHGDISPMQLQTMFPSRGGTASQDRMNAVRIANEVYQKEHPGAPELSFEKLDAQDRAFKSTHNQTARQAVQTFLPSLQKYTDLVSELPAGTGWRSLNQVLQQGNFEMGGKKITDVKALQTVLGSEFSHSLTGSMSESDMRTQLALNALSPASSREAVLEVLGLIQDREMNRLVTTAEQGGVYGENWLKGEYGDAADTLIQRDKSENQKIARDVVKGQTPTVPSDEKKQQEAAATIDSLRTSFRQDTAPPKPTTVLGGDLKKPEPIPDGSVRRNTKTNKMMKKVNGVWQNL